MILYFYNVFLISMYILTLTACLVVGNLENQKANRMVYVACSILMLSFIFDNVIISLTELFQGFAHTYNQETKGVPVLKLIFYGVSHACLILWLRTLQDKRWSIRDIIIWTIPMGLSLSSLLLPTSNTQVYCFYLPHQLAYFLFGVLAWQAYLEKSDQQPLLKWFSFSFIFFAFAIAVEDYLVIYHYDSYIMGNLRIHNRNFSSDFFFLTLCGLAIINMIQQLKLRIVPQNTGEQTNFEQIGDPVPEKEDAFARFDAFCQTFHLTSREQEICRLLLEGNHNQDIASDLYLSLGTVKAHIHNIFVKLNVTKRDQIQDMFLQYRQENE